MLILSSICGNTLTNRIRNVDPRKKVGVSDIADKDEDRLWLFGP